MKKSLFVFCAAVAILLCGCSSNNGTRTLNTWKTWVAITVAPQLHSYFVEYELSDGDGTPGLFFEGREVERISRWNDKDREKTTDLSDLASAIHGKLSDMTIKKYKELVSESYYPDDARIVMNVVNEFYRNEVKTLKSDGSMVYPVSSYYYNVDWLFESEENISRLAKEVVADCGEFSDFRRFVLKSTSVFSSQLILNETNYKLYEVIYHISFEDIDKYALCRVLDNKEGMGEIKIINKSDHLMDLLPE